MRGLEAQWRSRLEEQQAATQQQLAEVSHQHAQELGALRRQLQEEAAREKELFMQRVVASEEERAQHARVSQSAWKQQVELQQQAAAALIRQQTLSTLLRLYEKLALALRECSHELPPVRVSTDPPERRALFAASCLQSCNVFIRKHVFMSCVQACGSGGPWCSQQSTL